MITKKKRQRLSMLKDIYEENGKIPDLKKRYGEKNYEEILNFLGIKKLIYLKNYNAEIEEWALTPKGMEYYEKEIATIERLKSIAQINAVNSNINIDSPNSQQSIEITKNDLTPETLEILKKLQKAVAEKDEEKTDILLKELKAGAKNIFWGIIANGLSVILKINEISNDK